MGLRDIFTEPLFRARDNIKENVLEFRDDVRGRVQDKARRLTAPLRPKEWEIRKSPQPTTPQAPPPPKATASLAHAVNPLLQRFGQQGARQAAAPAPITVKDRGVALMPEDVAELRRIVFSEISNRTPDKQDLEARVLINTALNRVAENRKRGTQMTLTDVLRQPNQYQGYGTDLYKRYDNPHDNPTKERRKRVDEIVNRVIAQMRDGTFKDNTGGAFFYVHKGDKIFYDDRPLFR